MPLFGKFESVGEISQNARGSVLLARPAGSRRRPAFVVKTCAPLLLPGSGASDPVGAQRFLEAADVQQAAAAAHGRHWARIVARGELPGGAYYVRRYYPRTLEQLIVRHVAVTSQTLLVVMLGLVRALRELEKSAGRAHGNLKPSNVFFSGRGSLLSARVVVSDPLADPSHAEGGGAAADLKALGTILFRLVRRRDVRGEVGWPVTASPDWEALGGKAERWRELCNTLLDPQALSRGLTLADVERQLRALTFRGARRRVFVVTLGLPLGLAAAAFLYLRFVPYDRMPERWIDVAEAMGNVPPDADTPPDEWKWLCLAYYDWLGEFQEALRDPERRARLDAEPYLHAEVLAKLDDAAERGITLDARALLNVQGSLTSLAALPPDAVKKGAMPWRIRRAWTIVNAVRSSLTAWPAPTRLKATQEAWAERGWAAPAAELEAALARLQPRVTAADSLEELLRWVQRADAIEQSNRESERLSATLRATGEPLLSSLPEYLRHSLADASDAATLADALLAARREQEHWDTFAREVWPHGIDRERFARESSAASESGPLTPERISRWQAQVKEYQYLPPSADPRRQFDWTGLAGKVSQALTRLTTEERDSGTATAAAAPASTALRSRADTLAAEVKAFAGQRFVQKDAATVAERAGSFAAAHQALLDAVDNALVQLRPDAAEWLAWVRGAVFPDSPGLQAVWATRAAPLAANLTARDLATDPARFRELRGRLRGIETFLHALADAPALPAPVLPADGLRPELRTDAEGWLKSRRDAAVQTLASGMPWPDGSPAGDPAAAWETPLGRQAKETYGAAREAALAAAQAYTELADALARGRGLAERVGSLADRASGQAGVEALLQTGTFAVLGAQVRELREIDVQTDRTVLATRAAAGSVAGQLAAWRRLGALSDWPKNAAELDREAELATALLPRLVAAEPDRQRRAVWNAEFAMEAKLRWQRALRGSIADGGADVPAVFARMTAFGLAETDLDAPAHYNLHLARLKSQVVAARTNAEAAAARAEFLTGVQDLAAAKREDARAFGSALGAVELAGGDPVADLGRSGPANAGWSIEPSDTPSRVVYRWKSPSGQSHTLEFVLVETVRNDPFFLCTTEMPLGLMLDLADARPQEAFVARAMPDWVGLIQSAVEDQRQGPQAWAVDFRRHKLRVNDKWTGVRMPSWPDQVYAPGKDVPPPGRGTPAQYLDPAAARYCAERLVGCRLPTPAEWTELIQILGGPETLEKLQWNLRDARWREQQTYLVRAGGAFDLPWPDADIFLPKTLANIPRGRDALPATTADDGVLWFADVSSGARAGDFVHLLGNAAECLWDPTTKSYAIAGGSALSPGEENPATVYAVDSKQEREEYSDLGFRPSFSAPDSLVGKSRLSRLVREQGYLGF